MAFKLSFRQTGRLMRLFAFATLVAIAVRSGPAFAEAATTDPWQAFGSLSALTAVSDDTLARQRGRGVTREISESRQHAVILWDETQKRNRGGGHPTGQSTGNNQQSTTLVLIRD